MAGSDRRTDDDVDPDRLFEIARGMMGNGTPTFDADHVIAVAAAAVERRRSGRLLVLRVAGTAAILAVLAVWVIGFSSWGTDILYSIIMFAVPALVVLRWHLEALDGRGLRPWRPPATVDGWAPETMRRAEALADDVDHLADLEARVIVASALHSTRQPGLEHHLDTARASLELARMHLRTCLTGTDAFIESCRTEPVGADWGLIRAADPDRIVTRIRRAHQEVELVARHCSRLTGDEPPLAPELHALAREIHGLAGPLGARCAGLVDAFDTLHRLATQQRLESDTVLGAVRRATSSAAVVLSGWGHTPAARSAIRNQLLAEATDDGPWWFSTIRRAQASARAQLAHAGGQ